MLEISASSVAEAREYYTQRVACVTLKAATCTKTLHLKRPDRDHSLRDRANNPVITVAGSTTHGDTGMQGSHMPDYSTHGSTPTASAQLHSPATPKLPNQIRPLRKWAPTSPRIRHTFPSAVPRARKERPTKTVMHVLAIVVQVVASDIHWPLSTLRLPSLGVTWNTLSNWVLATVHTEGAFSGCNLEHTE